MVRWIAFALFVLALLAFDLIVLNRKHEAPSLKKAALQTLLWITIGLTVGVGLFVFLEYGVEGVQQYLAGYSIEYSLSVDNVFVWSLILGFFAVPKEYRHAVLFWGIIGTLVLRFVFIFAGVALIERFALVTVGLGILLFISAIKLVAGSDEEPDVSKMRSYRLVAKILPVAKGQHSQKFFVRVNGKILATQLFVCMVVITLVDMLFAVDSVPAVLGVSHDPFIVFTSNAMAIMGLRSLFFLFDEVKDKFTRLNEGLAIILAGVGVKMIIASDAGLGLFHLPGIDPPTWISLAFIAVVLAGSVAASRWFPEKEKKKGAAS